MRTTAVQFSGPRTVELIEVELGSPGPGEALVRSLYSGISGGTEMLAYRGEIDPNLPLDDTLGTLSGTFSWPFRYGYSVVGRIEESRCSLPAGATVFCFHPHQAHILVDEADMILVDELEPRLVTLLPLVETALQISLDAGAVAHQTTVVLGLGALGILAGRLLHRAGATVLGADPLVWRRVAATSYSIRAVDPGELPAEASALTQGRGVPLVIEASGNPAALSAAIELMAHEGTVLVASWFGIKPVSLPLGGAFHRRRLTIRSTQVSTIPARLSANWSRRTRMETALRLMRELDLGSLATHEFPLKRAADAFRAVDSPSDGLIHAAIEYPEV